MDVQQNITKIMILQSLSILLTFQSCFLCWRCGYLELYVNVLGKYMQQDMSKTIREVVHKIKQASIHESQMEHHC